MGGVEVVACCALTNGPRLRFATEVLPCPSNCIPRLGKIMLKKCKYRFICLLVFVSCALCGCNRQEPERAQITPDGKILSHEVIDSVFDEHFLPEAEHLIRLQTWRRSNATDADEQGVIENLRQVYDYLQDRATAFNKGQKTLMLRPFEWDEPKSGTPEDTGSRHWLFGFRLGSGEEKVSIITHVDTVGPGDFSWKPFEPRVELREYQGEKTPFLIGRGAIDDKGPAIVVFSVLRAIAKRFDESDELDGLVVEILFDTSEETNMATPHYLKDQNEISPSFGIALDALWTVRAEKGGESPVFSIARKANNTGIWIEDINTSDGPINQIPNSAVATIASDAPDNLIQFEAEVKSLYEGYAFDDPNYRKAELFVSRENNKVLLKTTVSGAQHGSVPMENRENGANPLVSLTNFLAYLVEDGTLSKNGIGEMCTFAKWGWGTHVFGEDHSDLLERHDDVYTKGNGTTYALTKIVTDERAVKLGLDIRYAIGHNSVQWDGKTEGLLQGESIFPHVFTQLVSRFNSIYPDVDISFKTRNRCTPDIRDPGNSRFAKLRAAFEKVMGKDVPFPLHAIGGGTDTKGHPELLAAGPLFSGDIGPPVNLHGVNEGVPIKDLRNSARILYHLLVEEIMAH